MSSKIKSPIVVALDCDNLSACKALASQLDPLLCRVKVGKELFTSCGPQVLDYLHDLGFEVFLDLKFHDIPHTVAQAVLAAAKTGVWMVNVHASGGRVMMETTCEALHKAGVQSPLLIAVTVLTSMDASDLQDIGIHCTPLEQVKRLAALTQASGFNGVVCSAQEVEPLRNVMGKEFTLVTPGIRPEWASKGDQKRVVTPRQAIERGSDYLVIGRPITQADSPSKVLERIILELK